MGEMSTIDKLNRDPLSRPTLGSRQIKSDQGGVTGGKKTSPLSPTTKTPGLPSAQGLVFAANLKGSLL